MPYFIHWAPGLQQASIRMVTANGPIADSQWEAPNNAGLIFQGTCAMVGSVCSPTFNGYVINPAQGLLNPITLHNLSPFPTVRFYVWSDGNVLRRRAALSSELPPTTNFSDQNIPPNSSVPDRTFSVFQIAPDTRAGIGIYIGGPQGMSRIADLYWECLPCEGG